MKTAAEVFLEKGFAEVTINQIAEKAELSVGTIYLYFKSKEELYTSLIFEAIGKFTHRIEGIKAKNIDPSLKFRRAWDYFYAFKEEFPFYYKILLFLHDKEFTRWISQEVVDEINKKSGINFILLSKMVQECMDKGIYKNTNPTDVVDILWSTFMGIVHLSETRTNLGIKIKNSKAIFKKAFSLIEEGLLNYAHTSPSD